MVNIGTVRIGHHSHLQQQQQPSQPITSLGIGLQLGNSSLGRNNITSVQQMQAAAQVQQQQASQQQPPINTIMNLNFPANSNGQLPLHMQMRQPPSSLSSLINNASQVQQSRIPGVNLSGPPPNITAPPPTMNRPPPGFPQPQNMTLNTAAPPPIRTNIPPPGMPVGTIQPGFPPGAHINPHVYPSFG